MNSNNFKTLSDLKKDFTENIKAYFKEIHRPFTEFVKAASQWQEQLTIDIRNIIDSVRLQFPKGIEEHLRKLVKSVVEFAKQYEVAEEKAAAVLERYKWLVSPSLPIPIIFKLMEIGIKTGRQDAAINKLFLDYFSLNNWQNLEIMVREWKGLIRKERWDIIRNCLYILQLNHSIKINKVNVILPALIAQIEGIWEDYLKDKGVTYTGGKDRIEKFKKIKSIIVPDKLDNIANNILLDILFQKSLKGQKLETPFNFNRHKILHGENVRYGRKNYLIRAFLIIDFLAHLE